MEHVARHASVWMAHAEPQERPSLEGDLDVDVCVVGAGITGLTTARLLSRSGRSVVVVDALSVCGGDTGHTTAHLAVHHDLWYRDTIARFGEESARLVLASRRAALDRIARFVAEDRIDCGFARVPAFLFTEEGAGVEALREELAACARLGLDVSWADRAPGIGSSRGALRIERQGQLNPIPYVRGLASALEREGGRVFERTHVLEVDEGPGCRVRTERGTIRAREVVLATNAPFASVGLVTKVAAYRSYAIALPVDAPSAPRALLWGDGDPYPYVRAHALDGTTYLIVGGQDHKTGEVRDPEAAWASLESWARARFPVREASARWSGQILEPTDGLPYIGRHGEGVWIATGFGGDGLTNGTLAGELLSQAIAGQRSAIGELYDPARFGVASAKEFVRENVDYPAHFFGDRLRRPDAAAIHEVARGDGKIVRAGRTRLAVHRSDDGRVHAFSPVCPHMGCHVRWNAAETSWDCPCHGSRFDPTSGRVLNGPAARGLSPRPTETTDETPARGERSSHA